MLLWLLAGCSEPIPPVAEAGPPHQVVAGHTIVLDGSCSFDPDQGTILLPSETECRAETGAIATYTWRIVAAPPGAEAAIGHIIAPPSSTPRATWTPEPDALGRWTIELEVVDHDGRRATDDVDITVIPSASLLPPASQGWPPAPPVLTKRTQVQG